MINNPFDANFYRAANTDLAAAGLTTDAQLFSHFQAYGLDEGRAFSSLADLSFYRSANSDLASFNNRNLFNHLQNYGVAEGRHFSPFVDLSFYRGIHDDLTGLSNEQLFDHLNYAGVAEGRRFSPLVDLNFYRAANSDLANFNNKQLFDHLSYAGVASGKRFSQFFETDFYLTKYSDLRTAFSSTPKNDRLEALEHLLIFGLNESRQFSQFFDVNYYRAQNSDLVSAGFSGRQLLEHFELFGLAEGRSFSATVDVNYYRNTYGDLRDANLSNWQLYNHFQTHGLSEGRASSQSFDVQFYLDSNADLKAAGYNYAQAYNHFLLYGQLEGRPGVPNLSQKWIRQTGTEGDDSSYSVAVDGTGNVYMTGYTDGSLGGTLAGSQDIWVTKYNSDGAIQWKRQLDTAGKEFSYSVADSVGNVYITGFTSGALEGSNKGGIDAWVGKYHSDGTEQWKKQLGTAGDDFSNSVTVDSAGYVYITGHTDNSLGGTNAGDIDAWVAKYDSGGTIQWKKQLGTSKLDVSNGIAIDNASNVYVTGFTSGALGGMNAGSVDAWVTKYDGSGTWQWTKQLGTEGEDYSNSITVDTALNVYIVGDTSGSVGKINAGGQDAWIAKYGSNGELQWKKQLGSAGDDFAYGVVTDSAGYVYITGDTDDALGGTNAGGIDAWVAKYDSNGNPLFIRQFGTEGDDFSNGIAVASGGHVYITGDTDGGLSGTNAGSIDAWITKYR
ncbi:hypothetical protein WA1_21740 [Scytonema hofmannii PCC 7110]|uniref:Hemolysin n=1 Tax=Scytonema hofmannii PCC 7110 TaxID=128403 RepID=A0A139X9K7_9CYAN|nr:SBBP repeat-containing protein [Scytonema hofmannii]KYC39582.1 hypothetical protein WA1_03900 [Scytonema hofmannii PCC 7110]KYC41333.1 hypothetical protein WA1_21740 [Scytonema hofmannii PCC 7110]